MLYNVGLVSAVQQSESVIIYIYPLFLVSLSHLGHHRALSGVLYSRFSLITYFIHSINNVYVNPNLLMGFPCGSAGKESAYNVGDLGSVPGLGRSLEKEKAAHSSILAWRIPWTIQSMGLQRVGHE